jgi:hypothetical protein
MAQARMPFRLPRRRLTIPPIAQGSIDHEKKN